LAEDFPDESLGALFKHFPGSHVFLARSDRIERAFSPVCSLREESNRTRA
jgi:hypothetical protein